MVSLRSASVGCPSYFSLVVPLPTPFEYKPANGNLLIDVKMYDIGLNVPPFDAHDSPGDGMSFAAGNSVTSTQAFQTGSSAFVIELVFDQVPEPGTFLLILLGMSLFVMRKVYVSTRSTN